MRALFYIRALPVIAGVMLIANSIWAQDSLNVRQIGLWLPGGNQIGDVVVRDTLAYVSAGNDGFYIVNVVHPAAPVELGHISFTWPTQSAALTGNYAYVAAAGSGLKVVNISNPASPTEVFTLDWQDVINSVTIVGNRAYVAANGAGIRILNITNPAAPVELGAYTGGTTMYAVEVVGNYAYAVGNSWLDVINISNPASPFSVGSIYLDGWIWDLALYGNAAYLAADQMGVRIINITNPAAPVQTGSLNLGASISGVCVSDSRLFVSATGAGLRIFNLASPLQPAVAGYYNTPGTAFNCYVAGMTAYVADGTRVGIYDFGALNPTVPPPASVTAIMTDAGLMLRWRSVTGATGYQVYSADAAIGPFTLDASGTFADTTWNAPVPASLKFFYVTALR